MARESSAPEEAGTWILTDGAIGMEQQGLAVARAVGLPYALRKVKVGGLVDLLPVPAQVAVPPRWLLASTRAETPLKAPWPRLVISIGRRSAPIALAIKRASGGATFALHIQDPKIPAKLFDLVAAPVHDGLEGPNVVQTFGAVHSVTQDRLDEGAAHFAPLIDPLPHPRISVLLGGKSRAFDFTPEDAALMGDRLRQMIGETGGSLLVTPSRRTSKESFAVLKEKLKDLPGMIWDGAGENPYFAFLAAADALVVTADSVNMVTEAAGTGKPVFVQPLHGKSTRLNRFHAKMREAGITRPFTGRFETWEYPPVNDTEKVAAPVREALKL
ncbi:mitochondrial fission ELM1 family protein [Methyloligella sp. 2.7D]|uniref:mitochondrial fission ELM1 family protein n=1 Tax=unclassified Methyloligella TaxID=2625955 RepID=UPI00157C648A|nr:mitochondrial fission ELM1 family protein [Methyloligella sp. GL2]QKP77079.1 mitochondrial fission ELM1 family protein [Methyloligella sp. GL2]